MTKNEFTTESVKNMAEMMSEAEHMNASKKNAMKELIMNSDVDEKYKNILLFVFSLDSQNIMIELMYKKLENQNCFKSEISSEEFNRMLYAIIKLKKCDIDFASHMLFELAM